MKWALRVALAVVIWAELSSLWVGFTDRARFAIAFPRAEGALFAAAQITTALVAVTAVLLWLNRRWAIPLNVALGVWSVVLIQVAQGPVVNQLIVITACAVTTALAVHVRRREEAVRYR
jgi:hypothetical protein